MAPLTRILFAAASLTSTAIAVKITLYDTRTVGVPACEQDVILNCPDIAKGQCCYVPHVDFGNALFNGLPPTGVGVVYNGPVGTSGCHGRAAHTGAGLNLCLGMGVGAEWHNIQRGGKREAKRECISVLPSSMGIKGRNFKIFGDVPQETSDDMIAFFKNGTIENNPRDIPEHFLLHEIEADDEE